jgi:hypothetical protein
MVSQLDCETIALPTGARIYQRGAAAKAIYGVRRGIVELIDPEGEKTCFRPGEIFCYQDIVWHNGGTGGFRSFFGYSEVSGRAVLLMVNGQVDLDNLGLHLINPAFETAAAAGPARSGPGAWVAAVLALSTLASLAWRAWRPRSRLEQVLELVLCGALLALAWRLTPATGLAAAVAVGGLALVMSGVMVWRGRHQPRWPSRGRTVLFALLNAALGALVVAWLW